MRKRILCAVMSVVMAVGVMTGCGSKNTSSESNTEDVSEKTEDQYEERMEAYLDYFQNEEKDYDGVVGAAITLDENSLPLLWLAFAESGDRGEDMRFQLCSYDKDKVNVLAEKKINDVDGVYPCNGVGIIGMQLEFDNGDGDDGAALIYDSKEQDFKFYDKDYFENADYFNSSNYKNEDDIEENYEAMMKDLDVYRIANRQLQFLTLNNNGKTAYIGQMDENDIYYKYLDTIGALDDSVIKNDMDVWRGIRGLSNEFKDNAFVSKVYNDHFSEYLLQPTIYLPDGTETDQDGMCKYLGITEDAVNAGLSLDKTDCLTPFLSDMDAEAVMRRLIKHPAYTAFDLLIAYGKELGDSGYADDLKFGDIVEAKEIIEDVINNSNNSVDSTESTESVYREDSTEVSQQENSNLTAWKQAYIDYFNNSSLDLSEYNYILEDVNSDNIPELFLFNSMINDREFYYVNKNDEVKSIEFTKSYIRAENGRVYITGGSQGYYYDSVSRCNASGDYESIFDGYYEEDLSGDTVSFLYYIGNNIEVSEEDYERKLAEYKEMKEFGEEDSNQGDVISAIQNY